MMPKSLYREKDFMERRKFLTYVATLAASSLWFGCGRRRDDNPAPATAPRLNGEANLAAPQLRDGGLLAAPGDVPLTLPAPTAQHIAAVSRQKWQATKPVPGQMAPMGAITRITVHHEGAAKGNYSEQATAVAATLRSIQHVHCTNRRYGDIGYHFIIDRQGRIWQGREIAYQGAHVLSNNSHNLGIMCLGNFNVQQPTAPQIQTLTQLLAALMAGYHIPANRVYAHRELGQTECPGNALYAQLNHIRAQIRS
jgi:hypothetical protein